MLKKKLKVTRKILKIKNNIVSLYSKINNHARI